MQGEERNTKGENKETVQRVRSGRCTLQRVIWPPAEILAIPFPEYRFIYSYITANVAYVCARAPVVERCFVQLDAARNDAAVGRCTFIL